MNPFTYPAAPLSRRHGPMGYSDYASYRPWLRDEFSFRCVYCLLREQWGRSVGLFDLDHFLPTAHYPDRGDYDNLLYCCARCNAVKGAHLIPDPCKVLVSGDVVVHPDGVLEARTPQAKKIAGKLKLDDRQATEFRRMWLRIIALAGIHDPALHRQLMGYPDDLPDLSRLRPQNGNRRPEGVTTCYFAQRREGTLPEVY